MSDLQVNLLLAGLAALAFYMLWCWVFPYRRCWWCKGKDERTDGRGNSRGYSCWVCQGRPRLRRIGAVVLGRERRD